MNYQHLFLFLFVVLVRVRCDYELQVRLDHYKNPSHAETDGQLCCREQGKSEPCSCSNRFTICIQPSGAEFDIRSFIVKERYTCPDAWLSFITGVIGEEEKDADNLSFKDKSLIDPLNDVPNPIVLTSQEYWPGSFELVFAVKNRVDLFEESFVDYIVVNWEIDGDTKDYESKEVQGEERHSTFVVSVRIFCINNTQGRNCNETKEEESAERIIAVQGNEDSEDTSALNIDSGHQLLVISLSVIGGIFGVLILVSLASFISYMTCCLKKKRKERKEKSSQSEKEPFLRNHTGNDSSNPRYLKNPVQGTAEDGDANNHSDSYQPIEGDSSSEIYTEVPCNRVQQRVLHHMAESARRASLQPPGTGTYSIIRRGDLVVSTPSNLDGNEDDDGEDVRPVSGYSMITRESMAMAGYVSEELSDVEEVEEEQQEEAEEGGTLTRQEKVEEEEEEMEEEKEEEEEEDEQCRETEGLLQHVPKDGEVEDKTLRPRMPTPPPE